MTHSFWAIMGGIAVDIDVSDAYIPGRASPQLTENGIRLLLATEPKLSPDIAEDEVKDKSKGDWLTKSLAYIQATWFCISCLVRVGQSLTLSLLVLNTFAHAICTIAVYFLWWKKPLDVARPLLITWEEMRPLPAYIWIASKTSVRPQVLSDDVYSYTVNSDPEFEAISIADYVDDATPSLAQHSPADTSAEAVEVTPTSGLTNTKFFSNKASTCWIVTRKRDGNENTPSEPIVRHDPSGARRWRLAYEAMEKYSLSKPEKDQDYVTVRLVPELLEFTKEVSEHDSGATWKQIWVMIGFFALSAAYGALHALAWNARFPTRRQRILWRVSSLILTVPAGSGLIVFVLIFGILSFIHNVRQLLPMKTTYTDTTPSTRFNPVVPKKTAKRELKEDLIKFLGAIANAIVTCALLALYLPARAYIVGESFRMVFYLPPDASSATQWEKCLPHIG